MTKAELVAQIASNANFTKAASERFLNAFLEVLQTSLAEEGKVTLVGFGAFSVENRKERAGRNPRTGEVITIKSARVVKFRPGKYLKAPALQ